MSDIRCFRKLIPPLRGDEIDTIPTVGLIAEVCPEYAVDPLKDFQAQYRRELKRRAKRSRV